MMGYPDDFGFGVGLKAGLNHEPIHERAWQHTQIVGSSDEGELRHPVEAGLGSAGQGILYFHGQSKILQSRMKQLRQGLLHPVDFVDEDDGIPYFIRSDDLSGLHIVAVCGELRENVSQTFFVADAGSEDREEGDVHFRSDDFGQRDFSESRRSAEYRMGKCIVSGFG